MGYRRALTASGIAAALTFMATVVAPRAASAPIVLGSTAAMWHVEHDPPTTAAIAVDGAGVHLRFTLAGGRPTNQFAAAVVALPASLSGFSRLTIRASADRPVRFAIQLRNRDELGSARWRRTMYADEQPRTSVFDLREFVPVEPTDVAAPPLDTIAAVMLGVDTVNTSPATSASIVFHEVRLDP